MVLIKRLWCAIAIAIAAVCVCVFIASLTYFPEEGGWCARVFEGPLQPTQAHAGQQDLLFGFIFNININTEILHMHAHVLCMCMCMCMYMCMRMPMIMCIHMCICIWVVRYALLCTVGLVCVLQV